MAVDTIKLNPRSREPLARQLQLSLKRQIEQGLLSHAQQLPSMRHLSNASGVSVGVVRQAIDGLTREGFLRVDPRRGVFVSKPKVTVRDLALVVPSLRSHFLARLLHGLHQGLQGTNYRIVIESSDSGYDEQMRLLERIDRAFVAGIFIATPPFAWCDTALSELYQRGLPCVQVTQMVDHTNTSAVVADEYEAGRLAVEQLVKLGHRRIGLLDTDADSRTYLDMRMGIANALSAIGQDLSTLPTVVGNAGSLDDAHPYRASMEAAEKLFAQHPDLTAVLGATPNRAVGAFKVAQAQGRRIPDDLSVIAIGGDPDPTELLSPPLAVVERPLEAIGRRAASLLVAMINSEHPGRNTVQLQSVVRARGSLGPPSSTSPSPPAELAAPPTSPAG